MHPVNAAIVYEGNSSFGFRRHFAIYLHTNHSAWVINCDVIARGVISESDLESSPSARHAWVDHQRRAPHLKSEDRFSPARYIHPAAPVYQVHPPRPTCGGMA